MVLPQSGSEGTESIKASLLERSPAQLAFSTLREEKVVRLPGPDEGGMAIFIILRRRSCPHERLS
jgi:hypothetical protein